MTEPVELRTVFGSDARHHLVAHRQISIKWTFRLWYLGA